MAEGSAGDAAAVALAEVSAWAEAVAGWAWVVAGAAALA